MKLIASLLLLIAITACAPIFPTSAGLPTAAATAAAESADDALALTDQYPSDWQILVRLARSSVSRLRSSLQQQTGETSTLAAKLAELTIADQVKAEQIRQLNTCWIGPRTKRWGGIIAGAWLAAIAVAKVAALVFAGGWTGTAFSGLLHLLNPLKLIDAAAEYFIPRKAPTS